MNEGKKFVAPLAEVVDFNNDDIITLSGNGQLDGTGVAIPDIWGTN